MYDIPQNTLLAALDSPLADLAVVGLIIFGILLGVLWRFAWGPIKTGLKKREDGIEGEITAAQERRLQAEQQLTEYQQRLEQAGQEVQAMIDDAKQQAETIKQSILAEARRTATAEKDRATREIDAAKNAAINEIAEQSVNWAFRVAGDAVRSEIKPEDQRSLIEDALKQFESKN